MSYPPPGTAYPPPGQEAYPPPAYGAPPPVGANYQQAPPPQDTKDRGGDGFWKGWYVVSRTQIYKPLQDYVQRSLFVSF
jgi:hypothetical protein